MAKSSKKTSKSEDKKVVKKDEVNKKSNTKKATNIKKTVNSKKSSNVKKTGNSKKTSVAKKDNSVKKIEKVKNEEFIEKVKNEEVIENVEKKEDIKVEKINKIENKKLFSNRVIAILYLLCSVSWFASGVFDIKADYSNVMGYVDFGLGAVFLLLVIMYFRKDRKK